jgi:hypothetical protein
VSELEHALREALADPPAELPDGVRHPLWDIEERIHRRRQKQRRGAVAALACAAVAAVVVPLSVYGSPGGGSRTASNSGGGKAASASQSVAPPAAVRTTAVSTAKTAGAALHIDTTASWVRTTSDELRTATPLTGSFATNDQRVYVIKLTGRFVDLSWNPPAGPGHYKPRTITTEFVVVPAGSGKAIVLQKRHIDLGKLGAVHTFTLH